MAVITQNKQKFQMPDKTTILDTYVIFDYIYSLD